MSESKIYLLSLIAGRSLHFSEMFALAGQGNTD